MQACQPANLGCNRRWQKHYHRWAIGHLPQALRGRMSRVIGASVGTRERDIGENRDLPRDGLRTRSQTPRHHRFGAGGEPMTGDPRNANDSSWRSLLSETRGEELAPIDPQQNETPLQQCLSRPRSPLESLFDELISQAAYLNGDIVPAHADLVWLSAGRSWRAGATRACWSGRWSG